MAHITLAGNPVETFGNLPAIGSQAPDFHLVKGDLSELSLENLKGKKVILNIFPSLDTEVCAASVRRFNVEAAKRPDTVVVCVSMDLPFAMGRFCTANGIENVIPASAFRSDFGELYGVRIENGPLKGLLARSVVTIDAAGKVVYTQLVSEITTEPDYESALRSIS